MFSVQHFNQIIELNSLTINIHQFKEKQGCIEFIYKLDDMESNVPFHNGFHGASLKHSSV